MTEISREKSVFLRRSRGIWASGLEAEDLRQENEGLREQLGKIQAEADAARAQARAMAEALAAEEGVRAQAVEAARAEAAAALEGAVRAAREEEVARGARRVEEAEARGKAAQEALQSRVAELESSIEYGRKIAEERHRVFNGESLLPLL
jgi:hypothetical protein